MEYRLGGLGEKSPFVGVIDAIQQVAMQMRSVAQRNVV